jgi:hypothetical protein
MSQNTKGGGTSESLQHSPDLVKETVSVDHLVNEIPHSRIRIGHRILKKGEWMS